MNGAYANLRQAELRQAVHDRLYIQASMFLYSGEYMVWGRDSVRPNEVQSLQEEDWRARLWNLTRNRLWLVKGLTYEQTREDIWKQETKS